MMTFLQFLYYICNYCLSTESSASSFSAQSGKVFTYQAEDFMKPVVDIGTVNKVVIKLSFFILIPREDRICIKCKNENDDECHFFLHCKLEYKYWYTTIETF